MEKWDAAFYEDVTQVLLEEVKSLIQVYKSQLKWEENEQALDIGCGPGNITAKVILPLLPRSGKLVGYDLSKEMMQHANNQYKNSQLEFVTGDILAENITEILGKERFTKVFSFHAFQLIQEQRKILENIKNIMKPGGEALLSVVADGGFYHIYQWMCKQSKWRKYMVNKYVALGPYHNISNPQEVYEELLEDVGFKVIECKTRPVGFKAPTLESLKKPLTAINLFLSQIPPKLHDDFMEDYMQCGLRNGWITEIQYPGETMFVLAFHVVVGFFRKPAYTL